MPFVGSVFIQTLLFKIKSVRMAFLWWFFAFPNETSPELNMCLSTKAVCYTLLFRVTLQSKVHHYSIIET